jgi:hypothetical protein
VKNTHTCDLQAASFINVELYRAEVKLLYELSKAVGSGSRLARASILLDGNRN